MLGPHWNISTLILSSVFFAEPINFFLYQELLMAFGIPLRSLQTAVAGVPALVLPAGLQYSHMIGWPQELFKQSSDYIHYRLHSDISR